MVTTSDTTTGDWRVHLREKTLDSLIESAKKICVHSDGHGDKPEDEKTVKDPTIRAANQMVDELTQYAKESLEEEEH